MRMILPVLLLAGCARAVADDPPPPPPAPLDALDAAVAEIERTSLAVAAGVADGSIDLTTQGPAIVMAYTRLTFSLTRFDRLEEKLAPPRPELVEPEVAVVEPPPADPLAVERGEPRAKDEPDRPDVTTKVTIPRGKAEPTAVDTTTTASTSTAKAPTSKVEYDKTGIASIDSFLKEAATLSAQLQDQEKRLNSARGRLTKALGLAKDFKPADAQSALKEKLGTGYKISLGTPLVITPGKDAKDPDVVTELKGAIDEMQAVKKALPPITSTSKDLVKKGAEVPKQAKPDLEALGPVKGAEALMKVTKSVKVVTKIPKDAESLSGEIADWSKILGG